MHSMLFNMNVCCVYYYGIIKSDYAFYKYVDDIGP